MKYIVRIAVLVLLLPAATFAHPGPEAHDANGNIIPGSRIVFDGEDGPEAHDAQGKVIPGSRIVFDDEAPPPPKAEPHVPQPAAAGASRFGRGGWELTIGTSATGSGSNASIGYYVIDNLSIHVTGAYLKRDDRSTIGTTWEREDYAYGVGVGYTFSGGRKVAPFVGAAINFITNSATGPSTPSDVDNVTYPLSAGLRLLVGTNATVNFALTYNTIRADNNISGNSSEVESREGGISYSLFF